MDKKQTAVEIATAYYVEHFKGRGIAPVHAARLKEILAKASRKGEKLGAAAKVFLKEHGIKLLDQKDKPNEEKKPMTKPAAVASKTKTTPPAAKAKPTAPPVAAKTKLTPVKEPEETEEEEVAEEGDTPTEIQASDAEEGVQYVTAKGTTVTALGKESTATPGSYLFTKEDGGKIAVKGDATLTIVPTEEPEAESEEESEVPDEEAAETTDEEEAPTVEVSNLDPDKMDKATLRTTLDQLKSAGIVGTDYTKVDDEAVLRKKLASALAKLQSAEALAALAKIDPTKLKTIGHDCLGLYVDLSDPDCQKCETQADCIKKYIENMGNDFSQFEAAMADVGTEEAASKVTDTDVALTKALKPGEKKGAVKAVKIVYDAKRKLQVHDVKLADVTEPDSEDYAFLADVLSDTDFPETMGELRTILGKHYEIPAGAGGDELTVQFLASLMSQNIVSFA